MSYSDKDQEYFLAQIQEKRKEMYVYGEKYGLNAQQTITCSQELDHLLNEYYQLFQSNTKRTMCNIVPRKNVANSYVKQQQWVLQLAK